MAEAVELARPLRKLEVCSGQTIVRIGANPISRESLPFDQYHPIDDRARGLIRQWRHEALRRPTRKSIATLQHGFENYRVPG